ncbi:MAG: mechanosensitive ion channel family protein [Gammaproteobacteria bacterium]|nr:mechanosensitive ion channel family protein [Gammaproteobacteria bacterium]
MDLVLPESNQATRMALVVAVVLVAHLLVYVVRAIGTKIQSSQVRASLSKTRTVASLATSAVIFALYFSAIGFVLTEFGVSLTAYLASASILGLAIGFGSQGLVQDVVTGLTVIFSDLFDIGDMVEISGQTGVVENVGMRFTVLRNAMGAEVFIPNRTINNVINYPRGYVRCLADITLPRDAELAQRAEDIVGTITGNTVEQFPGILCVPPEIEQRHKTNSGKTFLRVKFRIWPGRGGPLENTIKQEIVSALKQLDGEYADWMVTVNYEVERQTKTPRFSKKTKA